MFWTVTSPGVCILKVLALKENSLFWMNWPKQQITSHVPKVPKALFSFLSSPCTHIQAPTRVQPPQTHMYSVPGLCFTRPEGRQQICLAGWLMPPAMLSHRQGKLMLGANLWTPLSPIPIPMFSTHHQTQGGGLRRERAPPLSPSLACGSQYGLAHSPPCPEEVGTHWQPSRRSPSHPHTYIWTHTNTEAHKLVDRLTAPTPTTPHPAGRWPMDRGHVAGRNASRCWALAPTDLVPVCLPANYQPGTPHKKQRRSFVFHPSDCSNRPAFSSPRLLTTVAFSLGISCFLWQQLITESSCRVPLSTSGDVLFFSPERSINVSLSVDIYSILYVCSRRKR